MQDLLEKTVRNLTEFFTGLDPKKKFGLIGVTLVIIFGLVGMVSWASKTRFEVLYKDLNKEDANKILILLSENKIDSMETDGGKTIMIPKDMIKTWRLKIATLGTNFSGTLGYEVFDKQSFGTSSFVQKVNRQRALEGELVKTIKLISGVKRARVHLSLPESSPFVVQKKPPGASVVLELNNGVTLTEGEIKGVSHLISNSVEGMRPEHVVILDGRGKRLSENHADPMAAYTANKVAFETKLNRQYERQVEDILTKVVGEGKVIAKVNVQLDFTQNVSTETKFDNETTAVLSQVKNTQKLNGSRPSPQGIPGARSNIPGEKPQPGIPETRNNVDKELSTTNYNVPKTVTHKKKPSGTVKAISVAVMIDGKRVPLLGEKGAAVLDKDGKNKMQYEQWSEADIANFKQIVSSTLGIDARRGDKIVIKNMEFAQEDMDSVEAMIRERENRELIKNIFKYLAVGLTISLFFFLVVRPFIQWVTDNTVESVEDFLPRTLEELEKVQANQKLPGLEDALPQMEEKLNPEKIEGNMLREKIIALVEANPGKAGQLVHEMLHNTESDRQIA